MAARSRVAGLHEYAPSQPRVANPARSPRVNDLTLPYTLGAMTDVQPDPGNAADCRIDGPLDT